MSGRWRVLALLVAGAFFMENLDGTIIVTATQRMARSFNVAPVDLNVAITAYLLTLGVFIPVSGWVADRFGTRTVFTTAVGIFTIGSALCALSVSLGELTIVRVVQGIGGAMMVPVGRLVVLRSIERRELINAISYLTWPALAAPMIAPAVGGAITTYLSWRWIFVINLPLGLVAVFLAIRLVPDVRDASHSNLDWLGFLVTGAGLASFTGGLEGVTFGGRIWQQIVAALAVGVALLSVAIRHLRRTECPLLDLDVLRVATFRVTVVGGSLFRMSNGAAPFLLPLLFEEAFHWSPFRSGLVIVPIFVANIAVKPFTTPILRRFGFRRMLITSNCLSGVTLALCALFTASTPSALIFIDLFTSGIFRSIGFTAYNTIVFADVTAEETRNANTFASTIQQLTMGLGVALGALSLYAGTPIARMLGLDGGVRTSFATAFVLVSALPLLSVLESATLASSAGELLTNVSPSGHK